MESTMIDEQGNMVSVPKANAPKAKPKKAPNARTYTVSVLAGIVAERKGIDDVRAGKLVRSKLRANFDTVTKLDPSVKKVKSAANDGNRWPAMNAAVRDLILNGKRDK